MAIKTGTRSCSVTATWEYGVSGYTPIKEETVTQRKTITTSQEWLSFGGVWEPAGSLVIPTVIDSMEYVGGFVSTYNPQTPTHSAPDRTRFTTYGTGSADYRGIVQTGGDPIYDWFRIGTSHNHPSSISFDDGIYAGTLLFVRCDVSSVPSPGFSGYNGQQTETTGNGTAHYSGDVPLKGGGRPPEWEWTSLVPEAWVNAKTEVVLVSATDWNNFCSKINEFRKFKTLAAYTFTSVGPNVEFTNAIYQQAVNAITPMKTVSQPTGLHSRLVALKDALNSIT